MKTSRTIITGIAIALVGAASAIYSTRGALRNPTSPDLAPALAGSAWLNAKQPDKVADFKGRVTVLHFWTFGCINCKHNLPYYQKWAERFDPKKVQIIGVHTPETSSERDPANVRDAVERLGITYPILIDGKATNWNNYNLQYWPTVFLIDKNGKVRRKWEGELQYGGDGYTDMTRSIEALMRE